MAIWIIFFHVERCVGLPIYIPVVTQFIQKGNSGVDVFMFLSGFCLCLSLKRDFNLKRFYINRFKRLFVPYLIIATPFFVWKSIEEFSSMRVAHFFFDISGLSFWLRGCHNAWFVWAIFLFYIITPILYLIIRKNFLYTIILLLLIYFGIFVCFNFVPLFHHSAIAWSRLPIFLLGIIGANYMPHVGLKINYRLWAVIFLVIGSLCFLIIPPYLKNQPAVINWLVFSIFVIPVLIVIWQFLMLIPERVRELLSSFGKVSLEIYICHIMILHIIRFYKLEVELSYWIYLILPVVAILLSFIAYNISNLLINIKTK